VIHSLVVVGASFGGFDALKTVLRALPASFPVPLAIVQHQSSPGSGLATLLQRYTTLIVADAEDKDELLPGFAYLAPPGYHLLIERAIADPGVGGRGVLGRGTVALSVDPPVQHARPSIDVLFESAADVYGPEVVGVVLTGTGRDGAAGLTRIKRRGGLAIVQDPATATRSAMPEAALASTPVDLILPIEQIGGRLLQFMEQPAAYPAPQQPREPLAPESSLSRI
jgi:two-component system, chemotaxis family, protein-glutamate methylesterase/glutaminase